MQTLLRKECSLRGAISFVEFMEVLYTLIKNYIILVQGLARVTQTQLKPQG